MASQSTSSDFEIAKSRYLNSVDDIFRYAKCFRDTFMRALGPSPTESETIAALNDVNSVLDIDQFYQGMLRECEILREKCFTGARTSKD